MKAVLFDLDETLILDEPVVRNAFFYTARSVFTDAERASALAERAAWYTTQLWQSLPRPALEYAKRIGHSAFEGLWAVYNPRIEAEALLETALQQIRIEVWERALSDLDTSADAAVLAKRWRNLRSRYPIYPDADELLARLYGRYKLGVVTNGVAGLQ
ncbi:MAG: HAD family hydrolase, partial [Deinococcales bacterium]